MSNKQSPADWLAASAANAKEAEGASVEAVTGMSDKEAELLAPVPPSGTLVDASDYEERWSAHHKMFREMEVETCNKALRLYWLRGRFAREVLAKTKEYGGRTVAHFAEASSYGKRKVSEYEVYDWMQLADHYDEKGIQRMIDEKISWHSVQSFMRLPGKERDKVEKRLVAGKIKSDKELRKEVKERNTAVRAAKEKKGEKVDNRGSSASHAVFRATGKVALALQEKLDEYLDTAKLYDKMDRAGSRYLTAYSAREETMKSLKVLVRKLETVLKYEAKSD